MLRHQIFFFFYRSGGELERNKYPLGKTMRPCLAVELMDEQIFWAGLERFHIRLCHFLQKRYRGTDGPTDGRTQPLTEMRGRI